MNLYYIPSRSHKILVSSLYWDSQLRELKVHRTYNGTSLRGIPHFVVIQKNHLKENTVR